MTEEELLELLAEKEHESWANWMLYLFSKCQYHTDGSTTIPAELAQMWHRKAVTPYNAMTHQEQESDRVEVRKILPIIERYARRD
jgi:hypothetical protein